MENSYSSINGFIKGERLMKSNIELIQNMLEPGRTIDLKPIFASGKMIALGMAWHLDNGFWTILGESLLGWVYVGYKVAQYILPIL